MSGALKPGLSRLQGTSRLSPPSQPPGALWAPDGASQVWEDPAESSDAESQGAELELRASAFSPAKFATSVWEKRNEGKFH